MSAADWNPPSASVQIGNFAQPVGHDHDIEREGRMIADEVEEPFLVDRKESRTLRFSDGRALRGLVAMSVTIAIAHREIANCRKRHRR